MQLDFSEFHPLDHGLLQCRGYPGGWRVHLEYSWDFIWKSRVRRRTVCKVGRHRWGVWRKWGTGGPGDEVLAVICIHCDRPATEAEAKAALIDERNRA